jgi:hypothetical protein
MSYISTNPAVLLLGTLLMTAQDATVGNDLPRALGTLGELTQQGVACRQLQTQVI